ncbi:hypothetical protein [Lysobacter niastensis]|uniref:Uncharacterized protein n=1 Tax=Lysobacter niastensis TaxID=380629 RepID=A0ABS0BAQ6_9GAMM|nr:hypothetical protein [Lysobacter niastensis]MBF6026071.1 hypothetical protein [Lysobacter niastensis]
MRTSRAIAVTALLLPLCMAKAIAAEPTRQFDECWKATFEQELSGEVREKTSSGGPYGYLYSYEGDFHWVGEPRSSPVAVTYTFCFRERLDDGGALVVGDRNIELGRVGSVKLPPLVHESANYSYTSTRDHRDFPTLYGSFRTPGKPDSSLEIQLDRVRRTATVVVRSVKDKAAVASYMQGGAQPLAH